ncbi:cell division protein FtsW [Candidatus Roizmanbacteria bacterium]|nr:cell division protein FtsW [Candidatus Roizmanbacteria bacterium]
MFKRSRHRISTPSKRVTPVLFFLPIVLAVAGLFFVFESSSVRAFSETGDSFHYLKLQAVWIVLGVVIMAVVSKINYRHLFSFSFASMAVTIILLLVVLLPHVGSKVGGARRWIDLGFFNLQPTEFAKFASILYLSSWFSQPKGKKFVPFLALLGTLMFLIMMQPDMGTAIIIFFLSITIYFLAGRELRYLLYLLPAAAVGILVLIKTSPYRFKRLLAFFDPSQDTNGIAYHISQIFISLHNGGLFGQGFGASRQKYLFLPEAHTDSIFAIIGEEVGFVGSSLLIFAFIFFIYQLYVVHRSISDSFGRLLSGGIFAFFSLQIITNLSSMVGLVPLTGVPLPFISYGGSNMLTSFLLMGIVLNIAKTRE